MRIAFLGFGLIAGSIARRLAWDAGRHVLVAWSPSGRGPRRAVEDGVIAVAAPTPQEAIRGADLIVLAGPVPACLALLDDLAGPLEQRRVDSASHSVLRLLTRTVGQTDDRERRLLPRAQVCLDLDAARLEADERERDRATEHDSTVRPNPSREGVASVPNA